MHLHSRFGWVWREPTAPRVGSNDIATDCAVGGWFSRVQVHRPPPVTEAVTSRAASLLSARWADGFLEGGCIDPRRKTEVLLRERRCGWFLEQGWIDPRSTKRLS